ncbi:MAG TPA: phosphodiester glycosidase family protein [Mycobacteriales bacterium]|nr:phosphodiester glycosidase family protein [Mycobacteriales bacterium]
MPQPPRPALSLLAAPLALASVLSTAVLTGSAGAAPRATKITLKDPAAYSPTYASPVAPGVDLSGYTSAAHGGTAASNVLSVNLTQPGVSTDALAHSVTEEHPIGQWASSRGAVAAVNGDYFAIGGSQAPTGPELRGGKLLKATTVPQTVVGVGSDGVGRVSTLAESGQVGWGSKGHASGLVTIGSYNSDVYGSPRTGLVALFDNGWGPRAVWSSGLGKLAVTLVVNRKHKVQAVLHGPPANVKVPAGGFVVVGTGPYGKAFGTLKKGTPARYRVNAVTPSPAAFRWAIGGGLVLVAGGKGRHYGPADNSDPHAARTAIGFKDGGRTMLLVTVDRGAGSVGHGANEISDEMVAMGATDAVLLDGGGSTTLEARLRGTDGTREIGVAQDGYERPVPQGIGVFVPKGDGQAIGMDLDLDTIGVYPGYSRRYAVHGYDDWYGPAPIAGTPTLSSDPPGAVSTPAPGLLTTSPSASGTITLTATVGAASGTAELRVLGPLVALSAPGSVRLPPGGPPQGLRIDGYDDGGNSVPVDAADLASSWTYDASLLSVSPASDGTVAVAALAGTDGARSNLVLHAASAQASVVVRNGYLDSALAPSFGTPGSWTAAPGVTAKALPTHGHGDDNAGLRIVLPSSGSATVTPSTKPSLPKGSAHIALWAYGDGKQHTVHVQVMNPSGSRTVVTMGTLTAKGWAFLDVPLPSGWTTGYVTAAQVSGPKGKAGSVILSGLEARI